MSSIRIRKQIQSETLHLPELKPLIGKTVDITLEEAPAQPPAESLDFFLALAPKYPTPETEEREALTAAARHNPALAAVLEIAEQGGVDEKAIARLRAASMQ